MQVVVSGKFHKVKHVKRIPRATQKMFSILLKSFWGNCRIIKRIKQQQMLGYEMSGILLNVKLGGNCKAIPENAV